MLIGHYSVALALKKTEPSASLGLLFIGVQLADILFFPFLVLGIERASIIPGLAEAAAFQLDFAPFSHGLLGSLAAAGVVYLILWKMPAKEGANRKRLGAVMALAVFSHWVLDVIVHTPDMALVGSSTPIIGLGLWHSAIGTYVLEAAIVVAGLWIYLRATQGTSRLARFGMIAFVGFMLLFNIYNLYQPELDPDSSISALAVPALVGYLAIAGVAFWLDRKRRPRPTKANATADPKEREAIIANPRSSMR